MGQFDRVLFDDKYITRRQRQAFNFVSNITVKRYDLALHAYQGSWMPKTDWSGTTHMGAGVADLYVYGMSTMGDEKLSEITRLLRREGRQAAQLRGPFTNMPWHWHICDLETQGMDKHTGYGAVWQVDQYLAKGGPYDGLSSGVPSHNPYRPSPIKKWDYKAA